MKKIAAFVFTLLFFLIPKQSLAQENWVIENFDSQIVIEKSGQIAVKETINVDFGTNQKHGIYRDLPYVYENQNGNIYTEITVGEILQDGRKAEIQTTKNDANIRIRIGDANKTISGKHSYEISYKTLGVLTTFEKYDEFYWNVTGNNWEVPIEKVSAKVTGELDGITMSKCFSGYIGSNETCYEEVTSSSSAFFSTIKPLKQTEGMTIVVGIEKGIYPIIDVPKPKSFIEKLSSFPSISTMIIIFLLGIFGVIYYWTKNGRDFWTPGISGYREKNLKGKIKPIGAKETIVVEFTPPENLPPAIVGVISDERADTLDVTSTIIDLAGKGYLTITEVPKKWMFGNVDYIFKKTIKDTSKLLEYEKELLNRIFTKDEIKISELKQKFYDDLAKVKTKIYEESVNQNYFPENPEKIRGKYLAIGIVMLLASSTLTFLSIINEIIIAANLGLPLLVLGLVVIIFSRFMPRRTAYGGEINRRIKGYRLFIASAEKYRQKFFESKNMFNEVLPYAIVFGLTEKFASALEDMGLKPQNPSWYHGAQAFSLAHFSQEVSTFSSSLSNAISSAPKSSGFSGGGGGSSGGGFGGGGGGSW